MEPLLHEERQRFAVWVYPVLAGVIVIALATAAPEMARDWGPFPTLLFFCVMMTSANILHMTTRVTEGRIVAHLGFLFPMVWRSVRLEDVETVEAVAYRPLRDAGGWGLRWGRIHGRRCGFVNARGDRGVLIATRQGKLLLIGSQEPEILCEAIESARKARI